MRDLGLTPIVPFTKELLEVPRSAHLSSLFSLRDLASGSCWSTVGRGGRGWSWSSGCRSRSSGSRCWCRSSGSRCRCWGPWSRCRCWCWGPWSCWGSCGARWPIKELEALWSLLRGCGGRGRHRCWGLSTSWTRSAGRAREQVQRVGPGGLVFLGSCGRRLEQVEGRRLVGEVAHLGRVLYQQNTVKMRPALSCWRRCRKERAWLLTPCDRGLR